MKFALVWFGVDEDALVLGALEEMRPVPAVGDKFVLREIIHPTDDGMSLHPNEELCELESRFEQPFAQAKDHLVGVEDVIRVFLCQMFLHGQEPVPCEGAIFRIALGVVIQDCLRFRKMVGNANLRADVIDAVWGICQDEARMCSRKERVYQCPVFGVTTR